MGKTARAHLLASVIALMGLLNVFSSAFAPVTHRLRWLREVLPLAVTLGSRSLNLAAGFLLMAVAWNLAQRKRVAWLITIWLLLVSAFSHVLKGLDAGEALLALTLLGILWACRRDFIVRSDPGAIQSLLFALPYTLSFFSLYALLGFYLLRHQLRPGFNPSLAILEAINLATFQGPQYYQALTWRALWFFDSINLLAGVGALYLMYSLMRPVLHPDPNTQRDRRQAEEIVRQHGTSCIAWFALAHDKSYFFNEDATCVVPYVLVRDVALVAGDPIGPPEAMEATIRAFASFCEVNDWVPAFYQVRETLLPAYRAMDWERIKIGEEARIDVTTFDLRGKAKEDLRTAMNRARREGWGFHLYDRPIDDPALVDELHRVSELWLAHKFGGEMGFSMGGTPIEGSRETLVTVVTSPAGQVWAFVTWVPMYGARGWAADYMRRVPGAPNGVMEYLVVSTIEALRERGDQVLSLSLAPLANVAAGRSEASLSLERGLQLIYERFNTAYHYKSLYEFKSKFVPQWESRYLIYPSLGVLPRVVYAIVHAHMPLFRLGELARLLRPAARRLRAALPAQHG